MTIYDNRPFCNRLHNAKLSKFGYGNVIPNIWYHQVLHDSGKPDCVGIAILSVLFSLHKNSKTQARRFHITYAELSAKFNFSYRQLYKASVRLEKNRLIKRSNSPIQIGAHNVGNFRYITLNVEHLIALENTDEVFQKRFSLSSPNVSSLNEHRPHHDTDVGHNINQSDLHLYDLATNYNFRKESSYE